MTETFKTELVINNLAAGGGAKAPDLEAMIDAIVRKHGIAADPKRDLAEAVSATEVSTLVQDLVNALAQITGKRTSESVTARGAPIKVQKLSPSGVPLFTEEGEPIYETHTPQVKFNVKSDPNIHKSERRLALEAARAEEKLTGNVIAPSEEERDRARVLKTARTATEEDIAEADDIIRRAQATRARRSTADPATAISKYEERALRDITKIERDIESTKKRVDISSMQERLLNANNRMDRGLFARMGRAFGSAAQGAFGAGGYDGPMQPLSPEMERISRFLNTLASLDRKLELFRALSPEDKNAAAGRAALEDIKQQRRDAKDQAADLKEQEAQREQEKSQRDQQRSRMSLAIARTIAEGAGGIFDPNRSVLTTGLMGLGATGGRLLMQSGANAMAGGAGLGSMAGGGALIGGSLLLGGALLLKAGYERGTELQNQAEKVYVSSEPMFAREVQMRAARGDTAALAQARAFSTQAERRARAARGGIGDAGEAGGPSSPDVYSDLATNRFRSIQQFLGSSMGFSNAVQAYGQFRRQSGVIDMSTAQAAEAMQTGLYSGVPLELLATASRLGTIHGNVGGGFRRGLDNRLDIGTLRFQMETLERAGLTGAPAESILGQTLQRQEAFAAAGLRTNFDRDAMFQRVMQQSNIAPEQFGGITGTIDEMRLGHVQRLAAPGREIMNSLMLVNAFKQGRTIQGAQEYLARTSSAEQLEEQLKMIGPNSGLTSLMAMGLAPADQSAMMDTLRKMREGQSAGPARAVGSGTIDDQATERGRLEYMGEYAAIGAQRGMTTKAEIAQFQATLDAAAKSIKSAADSMQAAAASAGNLVF